MNIRELRARTGLSQQRFGDKYHIPLRTIQNWESDTSECPVYVAELLERAVKEDYGKNYGLIKWTGRSTNGRWRCKAEAESMSKLYDILLDNGTISMIDYDPFLKFTLERAGYDYDEVQNIIDELAYGENGSGDFGQSLDKWIIDNNINQNLTDEEWMLLISRENGNAYYQTFEYESGEELEFDKNGMIK